MASNNCNTYLIDGPTRMLIDPGHTNLFEHVRKGLGALELGIEDIGLIICTHAHPDHFEGVQLFKETSSLMTLHQSEWQMIRAMMRQAGILDRMNKNSKQPDFFLQEGDFSVKGLDFKIFHTPGHTPGSICIYWPKHKVLFTGDLIFKDGLGRTDLSGGDGKLLKKSIQRMSDLDIEWILPGHGDIISGADEVKKNFERLEKVWFAYI